MNYILYFPYSCTTVFQWGVEANIVKMHDISRKSSDKSAIELNKPLRSLLVFVSLSLWGHEYRLIEHAFS